MKRWPFVLALGLLGGTWILLLAVSNAESSAPVRPLQGFPAALQGWSGQDGAMDEGVLHKLNLSDHVLRAYRPAATSPRFPASDVGVPVWLYVGYYASQRTGASYHSPLNCLPGSGWHMGPIVRVGGLVPGRHGVEVNRVAIQKGLDRQLMLYWYQDRGRVVASEYDAKLYLVWDALARNRTDGALVRLSTSITVSDEEAFSRLRRFLEASWPALVSHLPS